MMDPRIAGYVPQQMHPGGPGHHQKPEWKRYKQYTRNDILSAIECVRNGMSALQASRKFGVPSRTLYDKVKKLGITTGRPMARTIKRSPSSNSPAGFPFGISGMSSPYHLHADNNPSHHGDHLMDRESRELPPPIPHPAAALLDATFLQQALEARGGDIAGRDALHAMAFAAAAHAAVNGMSSSPGNHGTARSPSPSILMKYMRNAQPNSIDERDIKEERLEMNNSNHLDEEEEEEERRRNEERDERDDERVEDLSMGKRTDSSSSGGGHKDDDEEPPMSSPDHCMPPPRTPVSSLMGGRSSESPPSHLLPPSHSPPPPPLPQMMMPNSTSHHQHGVIVQPPVISKHQQQQQQQLMPDQLPITIKEEILDERKREVAIEEATTD